MTERYLVVLDLLTSEQDTTFDWLYHDGSAGVEAAVAQRRPEGAMGLDGEEFVQWLHCGETGETVAVRFTAVDGAKATRVHVAGAQPTIVRTGTGPFRSVADRAPLVALRRRGTAAQFAAVLTVDGATLLDVTGIRCEPSASGIAVVIERGAASDRITWDGGGVLEPR